MNLRPKPGNGGYQVAQMVMVFMTIMMTKKLSGFIWLRIGSSGGFL
jgi:uncharacterized membrane protein YwzB